MNNSLRSPRTKMIIVPVIVFLSAFSLLALAGWRQRGIQLSQFALPADHSARTMLEFMRQADGSLQFKENFFESSNLKEVCQAIDQAYVHIRQDSSGLSPAEKREADFYKVRYACRSLMHGTTAASEQVVSQCLSDVRNFLSSTDRVTSREIQIALSTFVALDSLGLLEQEHDFARWMQQQTSQYSDTSQGAAAELRKSVDNVLDRLSLLGQKLDLKSQTLDGKPFDLASLRGQVTLIEFWGTRCKPCIADFPALKRIYAKRKPQGFEIVAVCLNSAPARIAQFCKQYDLSWHHLCDDHGAAEECNEKLQQRFGIQSVPTTFLVDAEGRVVAMGVRPLASDERDLEKWLDKLLH